jgi:hypothetical protein
MLGCGREIVQVSFFGRVVKEGAINEKSLPVVEQAGRSAPSLPADAVFAS